MLKIAATTGVVLASALALGLETASALREAAPCRVGVYDNRAIAIAWVHSEHNDLGEMFAELNAAREAGDEARVAELEALGPQIQRRLHMQGFGRAPVTDLLEHVEDRLDEVAAAAHVDAIVFECNHLRAGVERVDVTDELVALFDPSPDTLRVIRELLATDPVPLEQLDHDH